MTCAREDKLMLFHFLLFRPPGQVSHSIWVNKALVPFIFNAFVSEKVGAVPTMRDTTKMRILIAHE
jgi:hypothetical protein